MRGIRASRTPNKNIVICMDGTGQGFGGGKYPTNISKLYNMVKDRCLEQVAFYDSGVGASKFDFRGKIFGTGMSAKICRAYEFIFERFVQGDNLFLFGFSRGAASVSLLAEFLNLFGVLPVGHSELIPEAYSIFDLKDPNKRKTKAENFISVNHTMKCQVPFLGVWDTVFARGLPIQYLDQLPRLLGIIRTTLKYYYPKLPDSILNCYHALAIDDERKIFHPRIWDVEISPHQSLKQVWFCGMHTDVGGGYESSALSDITLKWMLKNAVEHGLRIFEKHNVPISPNVNGKMEDSRSGFSKLYARKIRTWEVKTHGNPWIHSTVLKRNRNRYNIENTKYEPWIFEHQFEIEYDE